MLSQSITIRNFNTVVRDDFPERRTVAHGWAAKRKQGGFLYKENHWL